MNNLALLSALAFEPRKAFEEIGQRPRFWFPLLLLILCTIGTTLWYFAIVDVQWLVDRSLRASALTRQMTAEQLEQVIARSSRGAVAAQSLIAVVLLLPILRLLEAVYYLLAGKILNVQRSFRQWFSLACWTSLPGILSVVPAAFVLLSAQSSQLPQEELQPLTLNALIFHLEPGAHGYTLLSNFSVLSLLGLYLAVLGVKHWSGRSWLFSVLFAGLPAILLFGIVAIF